MRSALRRPPLWPCPPALGQVSYLELYNEEGYDLLDPTREVKRMEDLPRVRAVLFPPGARPGCKGGTVVQRLAASAAPGGYSLAVCGGLPPPKSLAPRDGWRQEG